MATYRDEVIIIKSRKVGEADKIFTLFGKRRGKFSAIAKSVRKLTSRKRGHLETCNICRVSCAEGKNLDVLLEAEAVVTVDPSAISTEEYERIGFAAKVVDKLIPDGVSDDEVYEGWRFLMENGVSEENAKKYVVDILISQGFMNEDQGKVFTSLKERGLEKLQIYVQKVMDTV